MTIPTPTTSVLHRTTYGDRARRSWALLRALTSREFRARYRQSVLDVGWSLVMPITLLAVYGVIFTVAFDVDGEGVPYLSFVWTGLVAWTLFSTALGTGVTSLVSNGDLISKVYFPREVLPLSAVGSAFLDLVISLAVLAALVAVQIQSVSITIVALVPALVVLVVWTSAVTILASVLTVFIRDVGQVVQIFLRVAIFATPVMYGPGVLPGSLQPLVWLNPIAVCIGAMRDGVLYQQWPDWTLLGVHGVVGAALLVGAIAYTRAVEQRMLDVI